MELAGKMEMTKTKKKLTTSLPMCFALMPKTKDYC